MRRFAAVGTFLTLLAPALAQGGITFAPKPGAMVLLEVGDLGGIRQALPTTRVGKLLADEVVAAAWDKGAKHYRALVAERAAVWDLAKRLEVELPPYVSAASVERLLWQNWPRIELQDMQHVVVAAVLAEGQRQLPRSMVAVRCQPKAEGRWTKMFDAAAAELRRIDWLRPTEATTIDSHPAHVFEPNLSQEERNFGVEPLGTWMLHLPGTFAFGTGRPEDCGSVGEAVPGSQGASLRVDPRGYVQLLTNLNGFVVPTAALGLDNLQHLRWSATQHGELVHDELEVAFDGAPRGLLGALLLGNAPLPAQALPQGGLLQLRLSIDLPQALATLRELLGDELQLPATVLDRLPQALTGGLAIGVAAPAPGGLVPRLYLTLGVADAKVATELLQAMLPTSDLLQPVTYDGVACTTLRSKELPAAFSPTWCLHDGKLHIAESALSLRAFLRAQGDGDAMAVGEATPAAAPGEALTSCELRSDPAAIYRNYRDVWLPLYEAMASRERGAVQPVIRRDDLPEAAAMAEWLPPTRAVLHRDGDRFVLSHTGTVGGPLLTALAMAWGPLLSGSFHTDYTVQMLGEAIAQRQLTLAWTALEAFHKANQRWPQDLGELLRSGSLPPDALQLPASIAGENEPVVMSADGANDLRSAYRYFPTPVEIDANGVPAKARLISLRPLQWHRCVLTETGEVLTVYAMGPEDPIDALLKK